MPTAFMNGKHAGKVNAKELVLLTGADGYVATEIALQYMEAGFRVRGTFLSQARAEAWVKVHQIQHLFEAVVTKDMVEEDAYDQVMEGVTIVVHTASPVFLNFKDPEKEMLGPAEAGTRHILKSAHKHGAAVRRVIVTSSFAAVWDMNRTGPNTVYTEADWSPITREQAIQGCSLDPSLGYCAAKKLSERAAWDFMQTQRPSFDLVTLAAPMIFGPTRQKLSSIKDISFSLTLLWSILGAQKLPESYSTFIDIRDVARLHVLAATTEEAKNQRYLCIAGYYNNDQIASLIKHKFPEHAHRLPPYSEKVAAQVGQHHYQVDCSKCTRDFGAFGSIDAERCFTDTLQYLFDLEKKSKS